MIEQKPTAEALNVARETVEDWEEKPNSGRMLEELIDAIAAILSAKCAEIERLKSLAEWAHTCTNHTDSERAALNQRCPVCLSAEIDERNSWLEGANANLRREQTKNQQQRALLAEACRRIDILATEPVKACRFRDARIDARVWLSTPAVVELLKGVGK